MLTSAETSTYRVSVGNLRLPLNISTVTRKKKLITFHKLPSFLRFCSLFYSFENTEKSKCTKKNKTHKQGGDEHSGLSQENPEI